MTEPTKADLYPLGTLCARDEDHAKAQMRHPLEYILKTLRMQYGVAEIGPPLEPETTANIPTYRELVEALVFYASGDHIKRLFMNSNIAEDELGDLDHEGFIKVGGDAHVGEIYVEHGQLADEILARVPSELKP